jgi:hypothetical protein
MTENQVYAFYQEFVKPIYSEIEARWNNIPVKLLFETYAAFDHLKRSINGARLIAEGVLYAEDIAHDNPPKDYEHTHCH